MFTIYATHAAPEDPLSALKISERPEPDVPDGCVRVKVTHASLNRTTFSRCKESAGTPRASPTL